MIHVVGRHHVLLPVLFPLLIPQYRFLLPYLRIRILAGLVLHDMQQNGPVHLVIEVPSRDLSQDMGVATAPGGSLVVGED